MCKQVPYNRKIEGAGWGGGGWADDRKRRLSSVFPLPIVPRTLSFSFSRGPFLERPGNFSGAKANFKIQTSWTVAHFLAHKPILLPQLVVSSYYSQNYWNFALEYKHFKHKTAFQARKVTGAFEKQASALPRINSARGQGGTSTLQVQRSNRLATLPPKRRQTWRSLQNVLPIQEHQALFAGPYKYIQPCKSYLHLRFKNKN